MGRKSIADVRRREIVEGMYHVAREEGLENTSIAKIAKHMGIQPSLVFHYYNTKEEIVYELIRYITERYQSIYMVERQPGQTAADRLMKVLDNMFSKEWDALIDDSVYYSCYAMTFRNEKIRDEYRTLHDKLREWLAEILEEATAEGFVQVENPMEMADKIFVILDGAYYYLNFVTEEPEYIARSQRHQQMAKDLLGISE